MAADLRWLQRLQNLNKAFARLKTACAQESYNDLELAGLVQTYEFTFELAWKTLKDLLTYQGYTVNSPRETIKLAFAEGLIADGEEWLRAMETRNLFAHTYEEKLSEEATQLIRSRFFPMLSAATEKLNDIAARHE
ncbi:MAG: nucleotidyltransferase substrate binding protein [Akkermansia sp.]|nr:nucleotidyltransferase substrate binding protein [Akkermansia sp.]